jgi:hypothetical protein
MKRSHVFNFAVPILGAVKLLPMVRLGDVAVFENRQPETAADRSYKS